MIESIKYIPYLIKEMYHVYRAEKWPRERILNFQLQRLNHILSYAEKIPFYQDLYTTHGVLSFRLNSIDELNLLPTINKTMCRERGYEAYLGQAQEVETLVTSTSGSTGSPFKIRIPAKTEMLPAMKVMHIMRQYGWHPLMRGLEVWREDDSTHKRFLKKIGLLESISIFRPLREIMRKIIEYRPDYIFCTRSFFMVIADYLEINGVSYKPKFLLCTTEVVTEEQRYRLENFFQAPLINVYGCMESPTLGYTCKEYNKMHIFPTTTILEIINSDIVNSRNSGEIAVTNLTNYVMPLIRYRLGDSVEVVDPICECQRKTMIIGPIQGRNDDVIVMKNGKTLNFHHFYHAFRDIGSLFQYQIIYHSKRDLLEFKFHMKNNDDNAGRLHLESVVGNLFSDTNFTISFTSEFEIAISGKSKLIVLKED